MNAKEAKEIYEKALNDRKERFENDVNIQSQIAMHHEMIMAKVKENVSNCIDDSYITITINSMDVAEEKYMIESIKSSIEDYGFEVNIFRQSQEKVMDMLCKFNLTSNIIIRVYLF
jgi:hypothetical protein